MCKAQLASFSSIQDMKMVHSDVKTVAYWAHLLKKWKINLKKMIEYTIFNAKIVSGKLPSSGFNTKMHVAIDEDEGSDSVEEDLVEENSLISGVAIDPLYIPIPRH